MLTKEWFNLSHILEQYDVVSSAPCRLDCGASTDHRLTGLLCRHWHPATTTIALEIRTIVRLKPYFAGKVLVESSGIGSQEAKIPGVSFNGPFGLIFAILTYFGIHGVHIIINSQSPPQSGLGGSGAMAVATIGAILQALKGRLNLSEIVLLAHNLEDSLYGNTGLQDQASAAYGNIHLWEWKYGNRLSFERQLLPNSSPLERHILLAYSGKTHPSSHKGSLMLNRFKETGDLETLIQISQQARAFSQAITSQNYEKAGYALSAEFDLRIKLAPQVLPDEDRILLDIAKEAGCGAKISGHGGGGCVWAIGQEPQLLKIKQKWNEVFVQRGKGYFLSSQVAKQGLQVVMTHVS